MYYKIVIIKIEALETSAVFKKLYDPHSRAGIKFILLI